jgi:anti-sigma factor RsiW
MTCAECVEYTSSFVDGALDPAAAGEVLAHLDQCAGCSEYLAQIRRTVALLRTWVTSATPGCPGRGPG